VTRTLAAAGSVAVPGPMTCPAVRDYARMSLSGRFAIATVTSTLVLTGCGSASEPSPPTGIDELVVPTPSIDPADFVDRVDSPWLPLAAGTEWMYRRTGNGEGGLITVTVLDETRDVEGVTATVVQETVADERGRTLDETTTWFAQDHDGNVWCLGEEGSWEAGVNGAEAGLAMPAQPRVGDGFRKEYAEGVAEDQSEVTSIDASASVPFGDFTDLLETDDSSPLEPGVVERTLYARDVGLVRKQTVSGGDELVELLSFIEP
jgi:hypothetical protein